MAGRAGKQQVRHGEMTDRAQKTAGKAWQTVGKAQKCRYGWEMAGGPGKLQVWHRKLV